MKITILMMILLLLAIPTVQSMSETYLFVKSPPIIHNLTITPSNPQDNDNLACEYGIFSTENYTSDITWNSSKDKIFYAALLPKQLTLPNEEWTCTVASSNSIGASSSSFSVTILSEPSMTGSFISEPLSNEEPKTSILYKLYLFARLFI